jgi:hypothetical protein
MIKKLKNFICKIFGIKQCACSDEPLELHLEELVDKEVINRKQDKINKKHSKGSE